MFENTFRNYLSIINFRFTFSKIFGPETTQQAVFEETVLPCVDDLIRSHNSLIFSYGTTNAGKTYTVQGTLKLNYRKISTYLSINVSFNSTGDLKNPGLIPRTLHAIFSRITPDEEIKYAPYMVTNVKRLNVAESTNELIRKEDLLRMHVSEININVDFLRRKMNTKSKSVFLPRLQ